MVRVLCLCLAMVLMPVGVEARRVALVIGNSAYEHVTQLPNPQNDAADLGVALQDVGFEVQLLNDLSYDALRRSLRDFSGKAAGAEMALIYFAGHGIEVNKHNYLIPIDAQLKTDRDVVFEAVPLDFVLSAVEGARGLRLVLLDACRNNPFASKMKVTSSTRSIGRGLSSIEPTAGTLVSFAAKEGTTADDGEGRNSPYTAALLSNLTEPGLEINFLFRKVRDHVINATGGRQEPFTYGSLPSKRIYLKPPQKTPGDSAPDKPKPPVNPPAVKLDREVWDTIKGTKSAGVLKAYIGKFPNSFYAELAKARLKEIRLAAIPPKPVPPTPNPRLPRDAGNVYIIGDPMPKGVWSVVAGSYKPNQKLNADTRRDVLRRDGLRAVTVNTDHYGNLRNGLWAVIVGPTTRSESNRLLGKVKRRYHDAYIKRVH